MISVETTLLNENGEIPKDTLKTRKMRTAMEVQYESLAVPFVLIGRRQGCKVVTILGDVFSA